MPRPNSEKVVITGSAGFIGSHLAQAFKSESLVLVDDPALFKAHSYFKREFLDSHSIQDRKTFLSHLEDYRDASWFIHMGAITNTAETDLQALQKWNIDYSKSIWSFCAKYKINLVYASSAATYGRGENGFHDDHDLISKLKPLNPYGQSKHTFDLWALKEQLTPPHWYGLKFFNVYGPNEGHKGRMASSVWHGYNEILKSGAMTLFRSHNPDYADGAQSRDFIYVQDIIQIISFLRSNLPENGIYNCGTGQAGTFLKLATVLFKLLNLPLKINWVDTPVEFRKAYQYKTEATVGKLRSTGFEAHFKTLEEGVKTYIEALKQGSK